MWLAQGDLAAAQRWIQPPAWPIDRAVADTHQAETLMLARINIAQAQQAPGSFDLSAVVRHLEQLLLLAEADQRMADRITILALLAQAYAAIGDSGQMQERLASALMLAMPEGYIRLFVDEGMPMRSLLLNLRVAYSASDSGALLLHYINRLVEAFPADLPSALAPALLSERELAILQCIAEGCSVQDMAARLVISVHTVRTHVKHIYAKLDAHNRIQALKRAHILQLI
jgi:LuxR family maltose regulon positive regulatory protein